MEIKPRAYTGAYIRSKGFFLANIRGWLMGVGSILEGIYVCKNNLWQKNCKFRSGFLASDLEKSVRRGRFTSGKPSNRANQVQ